MKNQSKIKIKKALDKVRVELAIHRSVDHPNIVNLIEIIDDTEEDDLVLGLYFFPLSISLTVHTYRERNRVLLFNRHSALHFCLCPLSCQL